MSLVTILLSAFVLSVVALLAFIASQRRGLLDARSDGARVIFAPGEVGRAEEPAATAAQAASLQRAMDQARGASVSIASSEELRLRSEADASSATAVRLMLCAALFWLLVASAAGLVASIKLHAPDWLTGSAWLSFGRIRTLHLNAVAYGWAPMAGLGIAVFVLPRLLGTRLAGAGYAIVGTVVWNLALAAGLVGIALGHAQGLEWLELPPTADVFFVIGGALIGVPLVLTIARRTVDHLYVSIWYMGCALFWFPVLFLVANIPGLHAGVQEAAMNWWFGHNVLGLFYTPLALASIYYFLPKVIGRPVQSYNLSLLGFWGLAFFYGQVGGHHLIGGPVPAWIITLSVVQSMMMLLPVAAFTVNQHQTLKGRLAVFRYSPTLRFIGVGGLMYLASSVQGSLEALRSVNAVTHFTHYTVGHAHLGLYGFVSLVFFGSIYFIVPRITGREWPYPALIGWHFWLAIAGIGVYVVALSIGGWLQGLAMLDAARPFMDSVAVTLPYLQARTVGGLLMSLGHLLFVAHFVAAMLGVGAGRRTPARLHQPSAT